MKDFILTQEHVKKLIHYNPDTGIFTWRATRNNNALIGSIAGTIYPATNGKKYYIVCLYNKTYRAHRVAWLYMFGKFPTEDIDHIDGNGLNNKLSNLRCVTNTENHRNMKKSAKNTSGCTGIVWEGLRNKWKAQIMINGENKFLGRYSNFFDATCARKSAEYRYGFHQNHGENRPL